MALLYLALTMSFYGEVEQSATRRRFDMETLLICLMMYLAVGVALFAHPQGEAELDDFHWRGQVSIFLSTWRDVVRWPLAILRRQG
jgi:hypothetical protein